MLTIITAYRRPDPRPRYCLTRLPEYALIRVALDVTTSVRFDSIGPYLVSQGQPYSLAEALALGLATIVEEREES